MFETIVIIAVVILVALAGLLAYAATRPDTFRLERSINVTVPPERIFPFVNDLRKWAAWSPYEKKDPAMTRSFGGSDSGTGAIYEWEGNNNVGKGRMEITDTSPPSKVVIKLDFIKPFEGHNVAEFTFVPKGQTTEVTWAMHGPMRYVGKLMHTIINMNRMIGRDFEAGLVNLKAVSEK